MLAALIPAAVQFAAAEGTRENGRIKLDPQYHAPGCEPIPSIPTVGRWFARTTLDYDELAATSADCGQVGAASGPAGAGQQAGTARGAKGSANGWTYVIWSEETAVAGTLRKVGELLGLTQLLLKKPGEAHLIHAIGEGAFFLLQLDGDEAKPMRVWAAGDVKSLTGSITVQDDEGVQLSLESVTHAGEKCTPEAVVVHRERPDGPTVQLDCD